jgi:hypothetical protein
LEKRIPYYSKAKESFVADRLEDKEQIGTSVEAFCRQFGIDK